MKKIFTTLFFTLIVSIILSAQVSVTVNVSVAGGLSTAITAAGGNTNTITNLTVTGNIDARDVKFMRDNMPLLAALDLEATQINAYNGPGGTNLFVNSYAYPANQMPVFSFFINGSGNTTLKSIKLPSSINSIGEGAFLYCAGLTDPLIIPGSVNSIEKDAFSACSGFTGTLSLPNTFTTFGDAAFGGSGFTGTLKIPDTVTKITSRTFESCDGFTSLILPNNLVTIEYDAFNWCDGFTGDLIIPNTVTTIICGAFNDCSGFTNCYLPGSVTSITSDYGKGAFTGCSGLKKIAVDKTTPLSIDIIVFSGVNKNTCELIVPQGSKAAYQAATGWGLFTHISEAIFVTLDTRGGNPAAPITTTMTNSTIAQPGNPVRDGFSFAGWYKEAACSNAWDFANDIVNGPITLYAKWTIGATNITDKKIPNFKIYPNPATDKLYIKHDESSDATVMIFDLQGKQVVNRQPGYNSIDISNLSKGIYLVRIVESENIFVEKLIKE